MNIRSTGTVADRLRPIGKPRASRGPTLHTPHPGDELPSVEITARESAVADKTIEALTASPNLYHRGGNLVRVVRLDEDVAGGVQRRTGTPMIQLLPEPSLREEMTRFTRFVGEKGKPLHPPTWLVRAIHNRAHWATIRHLAGVIETPSIRPDGSPLAVAGYDRETGVLYLPGLDFQPLPRTLTKDDANAAINLLLDLVTDFPFKGPAHSAAWIAGLLTMVGRPGIDGPTPLLLIDASTAGSGKSLLADLISIIATGRDAPKTPYPAEADEVRKLITSVAIAGDAMLTLDNIPTGSRFGCAPLDLALTSTIWRDRILGRSETASFPMRTFFVATGNNLGTKGDTHRRVLPVRLEPKCESPEGRNIFRHDPILAFARANRSRLVNAALTVLIAYAQAGRPVAKLPSFGSYEAWSAAIRQPIFWASTFDPFESREDVQGDDSGREDLETLCAGWLTLPDPGEPKNLASVLKILAQSSDEHDGLRQLFASWGKAGQLPNARSLGSRMKQFKGRVCGPLKLVSSRGEGDDKANTWCILPAR